MIGDKNERKGYIEEPPYNVNNPYMFQISYYGGLIRSDSKRWYTNSNPTFDTLLGRLIKVPKDVNLSAKAYALLNGWVIVNYRQDSATLGFNFNSNGNKYLTFKLTSNLSRKMIETIMAIANSWSTFMQLNNASNFLFEVYWVRPEVIQNKITLEKTKANTIEGLHAILNAGVRSRAGTTNKLQSANPKLIKAEYYTGDDFGSWQIRDTYNQAPDCQPRTEFRMNQAKKKKAKIKSNVGVGVSPSFQTKPIEIVDFPSNRGRNLQAISTVTGSVVGTLQIVENRIVNLWVNPGFRSQGIASSLMQASLQHNPLFIKAISTEPTISSDRLEEFYSKFGFVKSKFLNCMVRRV